MSCFISSNASCFCLISTLDFFLLRFIFFHPFNFWIFCILIFKVYLIQSTHILTWVSISCQSDNHCLLIRVVSIFIITDILEFKSTIYLLSISPSYCTFPFLFFLLEYFLIFFLYYLSRLPTEIIGHILALYNP